MFVRSQRTKIYNQTETICLSALSTIQLWPFIAAEDHKCDVSYYLILGYLIHATKIPPSFTHELNRIETVKKWKKKKNRTRQILSLADCINSRFVVQHRGSAIHSCDARWQRRGRGNGEAGGLASLENRRAAKLVM